MFTRSSRRAAAGVVAVLAASLGLDSPAQAQSAQVTCTGTIATTLTPGLLLTPRTITTQNSYIYSPCVSSTDPTLTSAAYQQTIVAEFSCQDLASSGSGTVTIPWNNGQTSTFSFNQLYTVVGAQYQLVRTGTITAGEFAGAAAVQTTTGPAPDLLDCLSEPGITSRTGVLTLDILMA